MNWFFEFVVHALNGAGSAKSAIKNDPSHQMQSALASLRPRLTYKSGSSLLMRFGRTLSVEETCKLEDILVQFRPHLSNLGITHYLVHDKDGRRAPVMLANLGRELIDD